jgi:hypothetical protein
MLDVGAMGQFLTWDMGGNLEMKKGFGAPASSIRGGWGGYADKMIQIPRGETEFL